MPSFWVAVSYRRSPPPSPTNDLERPGRVVRAFLQKLSRARYAGRPPQPQPHPAPPALTLLGHDGRTGPCRKVLGHGLAEVIEPAVDHEDFQAALATAQAAFDQHQPEIVVGSSRGGAVAINIYSGSARLVLICPAWKKLGTAKSVKTGTIILHSRADDVLPFQESLDLISISGLSNAALIEVGQDHRLADPEPLEALLRAVESPN